LIGGLPITTERNSYGGQLQSFEGQVDFVDGVSENVAFIRAPRILEHSEVGVVAKFQDEVVAVRHGNLMAASFHPELTGATHLHKLFISSFN
ncbi:MAG: pyridoxal 5'-phosphate synthase glutaminase subunit PdxT, partial [Micrococcales bacterium]|nr:pyridoxal 5'-phosphate synthase glutaminase subunit PdxT [Micrococcales bacterium]